MTTTRYEELGNLYADVYESNQKYRSDAVKLIKTLQNGFAEYLNCDRNNVYLCDFEGDHKNSVHASKALKFNEENRTWEFGLAIGLFMGHNRGFPKLTLVFNVQLWNQQENIWNLNINDEEGSVCADHSDSFVPFYKTIITQMADWLASAEKIKQGNFKTRPKSIGFILEEK